MQITISSLQFLLSDPYRPGHICTEVEAQVLNAKRAESIRDMTSRRLRDNIPRSASEIQTLISEYDISFQFSPRTEYKPSGLETEALIVAKEFAIANGSPHEQMVLHFMTLPEVLEEARRRFDLKQKTVTPEDLGL